MKENKIRWIAFDGLRFFAVFLVVASHTQALGMLGQGGLMVDFFFVLSGFFITKPMIHSVEEQFTNFKGVFSFYINRCARILPLYWLTLLFVYWLSDGMLFNLKGLVKNMIFLDCYGHLWYLQQEMVMYLLTPIILLVAGFIKKRRNDNFLVGVFMLLLGFVWHYYLSSKSGFYLIGNGKHQPFRLGLYLIGIAVGYFYKGCLCNEKINTVICTRRMMGGGGA